MKTISPSPAPQFPRFDPLDVSLVGLTLLAPALGVATGLGGQATLLLGSAVLMCLRPPVQWPPRFLLGLALTLALLAGAAFLPATWVGASAWRLALDQRLQLPIEGTLTPQPWITLEHATLLLGALIWGGYLATREWRMRTRRVVTLYAAGILLLGVLALLCYFTGYEFVLWQPVLRNFGFFPNRNQTANLLAIAGVLMLALAFHGAGHSKRRGVFWAVGYAVIVAGVVINGSRAGVVLLFAGSLAWLLWANRGRRRHLQLVFGTSALLLALAGFLLFGGELVERLLAPIDARSVVDFDGRSRVQADALRLYRDASWHGVGLGNFESAFAGYRQLSSAENRALHPESDWLWLGIELGWLAPWLVLGGLAGWLARCWPRPDDPDASIQKALVVAGILFAAHGFVDVSGHRLGTLWPALLLLGLLGKNQRPAEPSRGPQRAYRIAALALGAMAVGWLGSVLGWLQWPNSATVAALHEQVVRAGEREQHDLTISRATAALRIAPLDWRFYFRRAAAGLLGARETHQVHAYFNRALFLEPNLTAIAFEEASLWLRREPELALAPWAEALARRPADRVGRYAQMLAAARGVSQIASELCALSHGDPDLLFAYLKQATAQEAAIEVEKYLVEDTDLKRLSADQKEFLFRLWVRHGSREQFEQQLAAHPEWMSQAWLAQVEVLAGASRFQEACGLAARHASQPVLPNAVVQRTLEELKRSLALSPKDFALGYSVYRALVEANQPQEALGILRRLAPLPDSPKYFSYLAARSEMAEEEWERAWKAWRRYLDL